MGLFERHCGQLCRAVEVNRLRMIYETLRDNLSSVQQDGSDKAAQLRNAALKSLTRALVTLDIPRRDPRLLKFHVELLLRFLTPEPLLGKVDTATQLAGQDRRVLAAECLRDLEAAFPGLLAVEAYALLDLAGKEITRPTPGFLCTQLSATVLSNLAAAYLRQQEEGTLGPAVDPAVFDLDEDAVIASDAEAAAPAACLLADGELAGSASTDEVLQQAADALADPRFAPELHLGSPASSDSAEPELPGTPSAAAADTRRQTSQYPADVARGQPASTFRESGQPKEASRGSGNSSPSGVLPAAAAPSVVTSVASRHSSRHSNLASATEADADDTATSLPRSALTAALRINSIGSAFSDAPTPRAALSEMPVLHKTTSPLRRFVVPLHLQTGVAGDMPRLIMDAESQTALQAAAASLVSVMRRLDAGAVAVVAKALPPVLLAARPSPTQLWPFFERHLSAGSTALLRAVLDIHDAVPSLFEGRGPSLVEKVLHQVNDPALSADHRLAAVSWVMRQHAQQCHSGGALLLADCWEQLLPRGREPPELAAIKVKALAACLSAGVGDEEVVCRAVCTWEGFGDVRPSEQQLRALTYALRTLHSATPEDSPTVHRARACLVAGILEAIVARPQLVKGVDAFLATCSFEFTATFLRAFNALLGSVEGQFDVLRERPEDAAFEGTTVELAQRVKAAVISRSSSLSGLMRGLSFKLSFTKRTHSVLPSELPKGRTPNS